MAKKETARSGPLPISKVEKPQVRRGTRTEEAGVEAWHSVTPRRSIVANPHTRGPLAGGPVKGR